jgi:hypothetical protein
MYTPSNFDSEEQDLYMGILGVKAALELVQKKRIDLPKTRYSPPAPWCPAVETLV